MDLKGFQEYKPGSSRYNGRISEDEWNRHKQTLRKLHDAKLTRQQILDIISKDFGDTKPTYGQLCTKFDKWGFHVYRQGERQKGNAGKEGKKGRGKATNPEVIEEINRSRAFSPAESSTGSSTVVPDVSFLDINDKATPTALTDIPETPEPHALGSSWNEPSPRTNHYRMLNEHESSPANQSFYTPDPVQNGLGHNQYAGADGGPAQRWVSANSSTTTAVSHGHSSSNSDTVYTTPSARPQRQQTILQEMDYVEPDDPVTIAARTEKANSAVDAVISYWTSLGHGQVHGNHILTMTSLAGYLFATRSYSSAFRIYRNIYDIMSNDVECDEVSKIGALMRCGQSATETADLDFMQRELHQALAWNMSDSSLRAFSASMLQSVETQISEGFNLTQGAILATTPIMRNLNVLGTKGCSSSYPGTRRLYWRLRLMTHTPFHSGCPRLLKLMSEILSWAWAAMTLVTFDDPALPNAGCLCKDGLYFDFVRMVTMVLLQAAVGFEIPELIKIQRINQTPCACIMCADLATTFEICPIETFTAIALLTVDRCRLDWTSCHPGGRHQELTPRAILNEQLLPTVESLLVQVAADLQSPTTIHTSDLYDDFLSCLWSCFETHDLPLHNARFDASPEKLDTVLTYLATEELNKSHPARKSMSIESGSTTTVDANGKMPVFTYAPEDTELNDRITAKRTRSNASSLKPSSSNASERSMIRIRKKLKYRTSADYLNSMSSYSSLSSRNSMNRFSLVTGLPELETVMDNDYDELGRELPPDLTPDEFRSMQGHYSWVPSRPGSTVNRTMSWRESYASGGGYEGGRGYSYRDSGAGSRPGSLVNRRTSGRESTQGQTQPQTGSLQRKESANGLATQPQSQPRPQQQTYVQPQQQIQPQPQQTQPQTQPQSQSHGLMQPPSQPQPQSQPPITQSSTGIPPITNPNHIFVAPAHPVRRDSTKTANQGGSSRSGGASGRGRWSAEQERLEKILRATP